MYKTMLTVAIAIGIAAPVAMAQDFNAAPNYGVMNLSSGFTPDPTKVNLRAGGSLDAGSVGSSCQGYISSAPDVRLNYQSGTLNLIISVASQSDTTLVINAPDGRWYCDDDGGNGVNPSIRFTGPQSGRYEIWVGTYDAGSTQAAELNISELYSQ